MLLPKPFLDMLLPHNLHLEVPCWYALQLRVLALEFLPVCHLQWGIWGLLQARLSEVPSFNFVEYGRQRLKQYRQLRPTF